MENENDSTCLLIKYNTDISNINWDCIDYGEKISKLKSYESITFNKDSFSDIIVESLLIKDLTILYDNIEIKTLFVADEPCYVYELMYVYINNIKHDEKLMNNIANLLNTTKHIIYYNAILVKTYIRPSSDSMILEDTSIKDIEHILYNRVYNKVILYDNGSFSENITNDIDNYSKIIFGETYYKKFSTNYLLYNFTILYVENEYEDILFENILNTGIEKCVIYTNASEDHIGNLYMEEFNKMRELIKNKVPPTIPSEFSEKKQDTYGRNIIYNKYKVLDIMYNKYI